MRLRWIVVAGALAAGAAGAQELVVESFIGTEAPVGARVEVAGAPAIEWSRAVEVRARTLTGASLTEAERAAIRSQGVDCARGTPRAVSDGVEDGGTFVVRFECAWLQVP